MSSNDTRVVHYHDALFPSRLRNYEHAPRRLYMRGRPEIAEAVTLGVVGSRDCTEYGLDATRMLVGPVARAGAVIVSGMARGIDGAAHAAALDNGSTTIAVMGCGVDICYPKSNERLFQRILEHGLVISEHPPGTPPMPYHFPERNRIIAMLSHSLLVVEAAEASGTNHTARVAQESIDVFAVPGPLGRPTSVGTNRLLEDGALWATSPNAILASLRLEPVPVDDAPAPAVSGEASRVWEALRVEAAHVDAIASRTALPASTVALALLELELTGTVRANGNRYERVGTL